MKHDLQRNAAYIFLRGFLLLKSLSEPEFTGL